MAIAISNRVLYGVQGEGRGHASRSLEVIEWLITEGHHVKVLTGGDAYHFMKGHGLDIEEIPLFRYYYARDGKLSPWRTVVGNSLRGIGLVFGMGKGMEKALSSVNKFKPNLIITDFEPYLSRLAGIKRIPHLAIDHQHFLTESKLPPLRSFYKNFMLTCFQWCTHFLAGRPDKIITSSFYHFPKKKDSRAVFVGTFIPDYLKQLVAVAHDENREPTLSRPIVIYLKQWEYVKDLIPTLKKIPQRKFQIFSNWDFEFGKKVAGLAHPHIEFFPIHRESFLKRLSKSEALITTAGNQVIGEAVYLGKPVLAFPEPDVLEQELNAMALRRSGFGRSFNLEEFSPNIYNNFEKKIPRFRSRMQSYFHKDSKDGRQAALKIVRGFLAEINLCL